jgi:hypothetical protein
MSLFKFLSTSESVLSGHAFYIIWSNKSRPSSLVLIGDKKVHERGEELINKISCKKHLTTILNTMVCMPTAVQRIKRFTIKHSVFSRSNMVRPSWCATIYFNYSNRYLSSFSFMFSESMSKFFQLLVWMRGFVRPYLGC